MHDESDDLDGAERELEAALRGLTPGAANLPKLDPIACAFEAGRSAAARRASAWRTTSAALSIALIAMVLVPVRSPRSSNEAGPYGEIASVVSLPRDRPTYFHTRDAVLTRGVDVLPASTGSAPAVSIRGL